MIMIHLIVFYHKMYMYMFRSVESVEDRIQKRVARRTARIDRIRHSDNPEWFRVNFKAERFQMIAANVDNNNAIINLPASSSLCDIFLKFVAPELVSDIWYSYPETNWIYGHWDN